MCYEKYESMLLMLKASATFETHHEWLNNDAYIIRYEDIIRDPDQHAGNLLKFSNLTKIDHHAKHFEDFLEQAHHERLDDWRINFNRLDWDDIKHIQEACENLMVFMGYKMFKNEEEYLDFMAVPSILDDVVYSKEVHITDRKRTLAARKALDSDSIIPGVVIKGQGAGRKKGVPTDVKIKLRSPEEWSMDFNNSTTLPVNKTKDLLV